MMESALNPDDCTIYPQLPVDCHRTDAAIGRAVYVACCSLMPNRCNSASARDRWKSKLYTRLISCPKILLMRSILYKDYR